MEGGKGLEGMKDVHFGVYRRICMSGAVVAEQNGAPVLATMYLRQPQLINLPQPPTPLVFGMN